MSFLRCALRVIPFALLLLAVEPARAEYLRIQLKVYGLDCQICARGVSASIGRLAGVASVEVSLKKGLVDIVLIRDNKFKMSDLRRRIRENGFRPMEATVTAVGLISGSKFAVVGSGESYDLGQAARSGATPFEVTFDVR